MTVVRTLGIVSILVMLMVPFAAAGLWFSFDFPFVHFDTKDDVDYSIVYDEKLEPIYNYTWVDYQVAANKTSIKTETYQRMEREVTGYKVIEQNPAGVTVRGQTYYGRFHVADNILYEWSIPIGDRNFEEFGYCLDHEAEKGICREIPLYDVNTAEGVGEL